MSDSEQRMIGTPMRWVLGLILGLSLLAVALQFFPVYHVAHERDETHGALPFLKALSAAQHAHFKEHGRYIGEQEWTEWPPGPLAQAEPRAWGTPMSGPWSELSIRPQRPSFFQFRLMAGTQGERAPKAHFLAPIDDPWFVIQARADRDGDQVTWLIELNSHSPFIYMENPGD